MNDDMGERSPRRPTRIRVLVRTALAVLRFVQRGVVHDLANIVEHGRLFLGTFLTLVGILSFASDRYCDGNTSAYYACTRPATYYYYPWWATLLIILGSFSVMLWFLRKKKR